MSKYISFIGTFQFQDFQLPNSGDAHPLRTSSPIPFDEGDSSHVGSTSCSSSSSSSDDELYPGSNISINDFITNIAKIQSKHKLSDSCVGNLLLTFASVLPIPNKCPSLRAYKDFLKPDDLPLALTVTSGVCYVLPFSEIVSKILVRYPYTTKLQRQDRQNGLNDIMDGSIFPEVKPNVLYFILNTDGVSPVRSRNLHVWPVILSMINLKPNHRRSLQNLILVSLYVGEAQPPWSEILPHVVTQMKSGVDFEDRHYSCETICLVADMPAKSSICGIQHPTAK